MLAGFERCAEPRDFRVQPLSVQYREPRRHGLRDRQPKPMTRATPNMGDVVASLILHVRLNK